MSLYTVKGDNLLASVNLGDPRECKTGRSYSSCLVDSSGDSRKTALISLLLGSGQGEGRDSDLWGQGRNVHDKDRVNFREEEVTYGCNVTAVIDSRVRSVTWTSGPCVICK
jgi:hypothetical protein